LKKNGWFRAPLHFPIVSSSFSHRHFIIVDLQNTSTMSSSLCSSNLMRRLASRRVLPSRHPVNTRGILTVAAVADRGGNSARWASNDKRNEAAHQHGISFSTARSFSTTSSSEPEAKTTTQKDEKDLHKESLQFQAETKQLLDIVTHSLYTDKEVFLRELVSNASDALEKLRHLQVANLEGKEILKNDVPLEIRIETDELNQTLTISDTGVGVVSQRCFGRPLSASKESGGCGAFVYSEYQCCLTW
jgi:hypothetical protein